MNDNLSQELFDHILLVYQRTVRDIMRRRNVVACGIGYKRAGRAFTGIPGLIVSVERKQPISQLEAEDIIPHTIQDVPTDVFETGPIVAYRDRTTNRQTKLRPARPGMSIGHIRGNVGTLGAIVRRGSQYFVLSNNHVLALLNEAHIGDPIVQPGIGDGGTSADQIATLAEFIPLTFSDKNGDTSAAATGQASGNLFNQILERVRQLLQSPRQPVSGQKKPSSPLGPFQDSNAVDAALALISDQHLVSSNIMDIGGPPRGAVQARLGTPIVKSGRTSQLTQSVVRQVSVTVDVKYGQRRARFTNQIMADPFSEPGDSGSLVLDYERRVVGLLFSGSDQVTVINPIHAVLQALNVNLVTQPLEQAD